MDLHAPCLAVFCDFDGTFSRQDVGATLARERNRAARDANWARFERGEITAWQYNLAVLHGLRLPEQELLDFLRTVELDPGARELLRWCRRREVPFRILSDGFDHNLELLQEIHQLRFDYDANHLHYQGDAWCLRPGAPDPACGCGTGVCKRGRIEAFRASHPGARTVHIGNGRVSDLCGAQAADLAFAKDSLATALRARGVAFEPFETLHDVVPVLERTFSELVR